MSNDTKAQPAKPPEKIVGSFAGGIGVASWLNESIGEDGSVRHFHSLTGTPRHDFDQQGDQ